MPYIHLHGGNQFCILMHLFSCCEGVYTILFLFHKHWLYIYDVQQFKYLCCVCYTVLVYLALFGFIVQVYLDIMYAYSFSMWLFAYMCHLFCTSPFSESDILTWIEIYWKRSRSRKLLNYKLLNFLHLRNYSCWPRVRGSFCWWPCSFHLLYLTSILLRLIL
jgi:hypothetical protein